MRGMTFVLLVFVLSAPSAWAALGGGDIPIKVNGAAGVLYSHDSHAGRAKVGCKECHYGLYTTRANHKPTTMEEMKKGRSCGACHNGTRAFSVADPKGCQRCHNQ